MGDPAAQPTCLAAVVLCGSLVADLGLLDLDRERLRAPAVPSGVVSLELGRRDEQLRSLLPSRDSERRREFGALSRLGGLPELSVWAS